MHGPAEFQVRSSTPRRLNKGDRQPNQRREDEEEDGVIRVPQEGRESGSDRERRGKRRGEDDWRSVEAVPGEPVGGEEQKVARTAACRTLPSERSLRRGGKLGTPFVELSGNKVDMGSRPGSVF